MPAPVPLRPCSLCGGVSARLLWSESRGRLVRCLGCGLVYADSIDTVDAQYWGEDVPSNQGDFYWDLAHRNVYDHFLRTFVRPGEKLLDVGSGKGYFVAECRRRGIFADGFDVSAKVVDWATVRHGPWFKQGLIEASELAADAYDVVTLWDVVEHLPNPLEVLAACARVLRPGGRLFCETPNIGFHLPYARLKRLVGFAPEHETYLELPDHIHQFSPVTLKLMCEKAGLVNPSVLVLPPIASVVGRRSILLSSLKRAYVIGARALYTILGINVSNTVHLLAFRP